MKRIHVTGLFILCFALLVSTAALSQVPVAVIPVGGSDSDRNTLTQEIRREIAALGGISVIGDNELKQVMRFHEKAQALGSEAHDPSRLKVAEYIVKGTVEGGRARLSVLSINTNLEIHNTAFQYRGVSKYSVNREIGKIRDAIYINAYSRNRKLPSGTAPYIKSIKELVQSLSMGDAASYPYIAFYKGGDYRHPKAGNKRMARMAKVMLREIRPRLVRAKIIFAGTKAKQNMVSVWVFADKMGSKKKHRFDFMDLRDGSLGIVEYAPEQ